MFVFEIIYCNKVIKKSVAYPIKGWASAIARNDVYRLIEEGKTKNHVFDIRKFRIKVSENNNVVYDVALR